MKYIEVCNFKKYQHYSDRPMIWIKWYYSAFQDYKISKLTDSERWLFLGIIAMVAHTSAPIPADPLHIRDSVLQRNGKGLSKVRAGIDKLVKLKLIRLVNASLEKSRVDKRREEKISSSKKTKRYYNGMEMRFSKNKWWCIPLDGGKWLEFAGKLSETELK